MDNPDNSLLSGYFKAYRQIAVDDLWNAMEKEKWRRYIPFVRFMRSFRPSDRILEMGCGQGGLAAELHRQRGIGVIGFDLSADYLRVATRSSGIQDAVCGIAEYLPFKRESFEVIICDSMLEHVLDVDIVLGNITKALKNQGYLYVNVPYKEDIATYEVHRGVRQHLRTFDEITLRRVLALYEIRRSKGMIIRYGSVGIPSRFRNLANFYWLVYRVVRYAMSRVLGRRWGMIPLDIIYLALHLSEPIFMAVEAVKSQQTSPQTRKI